MYSVIPVVVGLRLISFILARTHRGIIRHTSSQDGIRIFLVLLFGSILLALSNVVRYFFIDALFNIPFSVIIIEFLLAAVLLIGSRLTIRLVYTKSNAAGRGIKKVILYGAGEAGIIAKRTIDRDGYSGLKVIAFIDDNKKLAKKRIEGATIYHTNQLEQLLQKNKISELIIAAQKILPENKKRAIETCLRYDVKVRNVPPANRWINGALSLNQIQTVKIDDLLGRAPIQLNTEGIQSYLNNKRVLITGAAGSIGSELVRQVMGFNPSELVLVDQAESPLYDLDLELRATFVGKHNFHIVIADITQQERMKRVFEHFKPEVVFHAAAYKHVPLMEENPSEALITNVLGTKHLVDLSLEFSVHKFVMISTDKAVNPTNVMGCTKRVAEIYAQTHNQLSATQFITTRFGNVLGSNGSVIPLFKKQIENGGPVTITHPEITRFFMTIPEACQLVLEAGSMGKGGEVFVFDMGKSVKIIDLAKKMIQLSGLTLGKDIEITISGLRPGEKLYEELLATEENTLPTHHPQILIGKVKEYTIADVKNQINELVPLFHKQDNMAIVSKLKAIVPEYISNNSVYSKLDD